MQNLSIEIPPRQTAFLTYTSGTTGRPKGVMQTHRQFRRSALRCNDAMQYTEDDRIPLFSMVSTGFGAGTGLRGDVAEWCDALPFFTKDKKYRRTIADWIVAGELTILAPLASLFRALAKTIDDRLVFANVRAVMLHRESRFHRGRFPDIPAAFPTTSILVHTLASSETATSLGRVGPLAAMYLPGAASGWSCCRGMDVVLIDDDDQPVARGEIGEILVRSQYLANGYWRDPELTAKRFSADVDGSGTRVLRHPRPGRMNADGLLEYCGRKDDRLKIRGYRIEPLDIELALKSLPGIDCAAVAAVARGNHEPLLCAFVVKASNASWTVPRLNSRSEQVCRSTWCRQNLVLGRPALE